MSASCDARAQPSDTECAGAWAAESLLEEAGHLNAEEFEEVMRRQMMLYTQVPCFALLWIAIYIVHLIIVVPVMLQDF